MAQKNYPSNFGYTILVGSKNENTLEVDPVNQRSYSSFGAGIFWDVSPRQKSSFIFELEATRRKGNIGLAEKEIKEVNLYYLQGGISTKLSYKAEPNFKPYIIGGIYAMGLLFREKMSVPDGYLDQAIEWRIGLGLSHIFFSRKISFEASYRNALLTYKQGTIRNGMESVFFTLRYYWARGFIEDFELQDLGILN